jgi:hypothetical protein
VEASVKLDSSDVTAVEEATEAGGVPEALDTVGGGTTEALLSVAGGAPGLLVSADGGTEEPEAGGAGGAGALLPVAGGAEDSVKADEGTTGTVDWTPDVEGPGAETEADIGGA